VARRVDAPGLLVKSELNPLFDSLIRLKFNPQHIVDVGAHHGSWTRTARSYFPHAHFTLIEPQPALRSKLRDLLSDSSRVRLHSVGVADVEGELAFTIHNRDDSCTFALPAQIAAERGLRQVKAPVVRLDTLLRDCGLPSPEMIKIDAEGYDLKVVEGAKASIRSAELVLIEASIACKDYLNDLKTAVNTFSELGFRPFDITDLNRAEEHGCLWLIEIAFCRIGGFLDSQIITR
jgi:FkbM family methyltransferase